MIGETCDSLTEPRPGPPSHDWPNTAASKVEAAWACSATRVLSLRLSARRLGPRRGCRES